MDLSALKLTARRKGLLEKMEIASMEDLLHTYPFRYENIQAIPFEQWQEKDNVAFEGLICTPANVVRLPGNRSMTRFKVLSWNEEIQITLFNRPWPGQFIFGNPITIFGVYEGKNRVVASNYNFQPLQVQQGLRPVYSLPREMKQSDIKAILDKALPLASSLPELIPERYREKYRLLPRATAIQWIHRPADEKHLHAAIRTLKYEEFLLFQCVLQSHVSHVVNKEPKVFDQQRIEDQIQALPYALTADQRKAVDEILADMRSEKQMYRLVQGDVGCGKTAVASIALKACELAGMQAALLAPTEILASQHVESLKKLGIEAELLCASLPAARKRELLEEIRHGNVAVIVGTHALFQEDVVFDQLGLVIADEQQRFGVRQRRALIEKGDTPDFLMMSATPIPRTYAHFLFGDIALSSIHTLPPGRLPVATTFVPKASMGPALPEILQGLQEGRQLYVVCPAISENPELDIKAVEKIYEGMQKTLGNLFSIGLLHGKMKADAKEAVMAEFAAGKIQVLVSTTVVEVGIDVPNANMMVIYDAHRFGLSTLHQLRGRAARSSRQGQCWLLSDTKDVQARDRLKKLEELLDGFSISEYDLKLRGPGDLLGLRQSGLPAFILGDFEKDPAMMEACVQDAREILAAGVDKEILDYVVDAAQASKYID